tara:strand:- start:392 stop:523 length:132 start_codon:yes stop_codon:yes gene_type:complete
LLFLVLEVGVSRAAQRASQVLVAGVLEGMLQAQPQYQQHVLLQ